MISNPKSKTHSLSSQPSSIVSDLQTHNLLIDLIKKPFDSPFNVFHSLINARFLKNPNQRALLLDSLSKMSDEQAEFPDWVEETADKSSGLARLRSKEFISDRDCLFLIYACKLSSLSLTLYYANDAKLDFAVFGHTSIDHSHWLFDNGLYFRLQHRVEEHDTLHHGQNVYRQHSLNTEFKTQTGAEPTRPRLTNYNKHKHLKVQHDSDQFGNLKDKNSRSQGGFAEEQKFPRALNKPKSDGLLTYKQVSRKMPDKDRADHALRPTLKYSTALSNLQNVDCNRKPSDASDLGVYRSPKLSPSDKKPMKLNLNSEEKNEQPGSPDDFVRALQYIAVYQQRFRKTMRSMAKGKVCELKSEDVSKDYFEGYLKFYNEKSKFGFIKGSQGEEIFLHKDNLIKSRIDSQNLECCSQFFDILLKYQKLVYRGKGEASVKAVNIEIVNFVPKTM